MKKCNTCNAQIDDASLFCPYCGSKDISIIEGTTAEVVQNAENTTQGQQYAVLNNEVVSMQSNGENVTPVTKGENYIAGIVGAFLFSIIGGVLFFLVYQLGFVAGICGLVTFVLANFGYELLGNAKNKNSIVGLISSIVITFVMIYIAEYLCISFEIFKLYKEFDITFFDAVKVTPEFLEDPDVASAFAGDLVMSYALAIIATIGNVITRFKARKQK